MVLYFYFGYHSPEDWDVFQIDPEFDCESTGVLEVRAVSAERARDLGCQVAAKYLSELHGCHSSYRWSPTDYAVFLQEELDEHDVDVQPPVVGESNMPTFEQIRGAFGD